MTNPISVSLPAALADHPRAASIEPVAIPAPPVFAGDGEVERRAAIAFRHRLPVVVRALPVDHQRGLMAYADAVERVAGAGGGGPDLSGVRTAPVGVPAGPVQREYLTLLETGGTRSPDGAALLVPGKIRLNKFGNIPRKGTARAAGRANAFVGKAGRADRAGVWQRVGKGKGRSLRLLVAFEEKARYAPRLGFGDGAQKTAAARLPKRLTDALERAIRTARRKG